MFIPVRVTKREMFDFHAISGADLIGRLVLETLNNILSLIYPTLLSRYERERVGVVCPCPFLPLHRYMTLQYKSDIVTVLIFNY